MCAEADRTGQRDRDTWVDVGRVTKVFGLKGEVVVHFFGDSPARFDPGNRVHLLAGDERRVLRIAARRQMPKKLVVRFEGCERVEDAEPYVGGLLQVQVADLPPLAEGEFYHHELIGLRVFAADGRLLGVLEEIIVTPSNDVYCVRGEGRETLVPAIGDAIARIDPRTGEMVLKDLKGLVES